MTGFFAPDFVPTLPTRKPKNCNLAPEPQLDVILSFRITDAFLGIVLCSKSLQHCRLYGS